MTTLFVADYGAVGDGEIDNSEALRRLRDDVRSGPDVQYAVHFEPGRHYVYEDNSWWMFGPRRVRLEFNGSAVECISPSLWTRSNGVVAAKSPLEYWPDDSTFSNQIAEVPSGIRFGSVDLGARVLELAEDPWPELAPGQPVLLGGLIQQTKEVDGVLMSAGWPPNFRVFEFNWVETVEGRLLGLALPTRHAYDNAWQDLDHGTVVPGLTNRYGKPRVWQCDPPGYSIIRHLHMRGARLLPNRERLARGDALAGFQPPSALHLVIEECHTADELAFAPTQSGLVEIRRCNIMRMEIDKILEQMVVDGCTFRKNVSSGGAGVRDLEFLRTLIAGSFWGKPLERLVFSPGCRVQEDLRIEKHLWLPVDFLVQAEYRGGNP